MVVAALCEQFLPSSRGLTRDLDATSAAFDDNNNDGLLWQQQPQPQPQPRPLQPQHPLPLQPHQQQHPLTQSSPISPPSQSPYLNSAVPASTTTVAASAGSASAAATKQRRKRFRATKCLASLAADFDVVADWVFYFHCRYADRIYREEHYNNYGRQQQQQWQDDNYYSYDKGDAGSASTEIPHLIPPILLTAVFVVCILGTILWLVLATDGKVATPFLRALNIDKLSMGWVLFVSVIVEDIPQVILTCLIEDYFEEDEQFSNYALLNVLSSLYDTLIKLAEAYDERTDIVETGIWCKKTIDSAHTKRVTCVIPLHPILPPPPSATTTTTGMTTMMNVPHSQQQPYQRQQSSNRRSSSSSLSHIHSTSRSSNTRMHLLPSDLSTQQSGSQPQLLQQSNDGSNPQQQQQQQQFHMNRPQNQTLQSLRSVVLETPLPNLRFLSCSMDGTAKLWDTANTTSQQQLHSNTNNNNHQDKDDYRTTFHGHRSGISCMVWLERHHSHRKQQQQQQIPGTSNIATAAGSNNNSFLEDDTYFITGSYDGTCKLWNAKIGGPCLRTYTVGHQQQQRRTSLFSRSSWKVTSLIHLRDTRSSPAENDRDLLVAGFKSGIVRIWDIWNGNFLAEFQAHGPTSSSSIHCMCPVGTDKNDNNSQLQFATGSNDCTIRVWNLDSSLLPPNNNNVVSSPPLVPTTDSNDESKVSGILSMIPTFSRSFASSWDTTDSKSGDHSHNGYRLDESASTSSHAADQNPLGNSVPTQTLIGHMAAVLSVASISSSSNLLLSGSADRTARLWSLIGSGGSCLRIFLGHTDAVTTVAVVDDVTVMTGSKDKTIKVWDCVSANMVRNYTGHKGQVTHVAPATNGTFLSAGDDNTIRAWIFTSVVPSWHDHEEETLQDVLGITQDNVCNPCSVGLGSSSMNGQLT